MTGSAATFSPGYPSLAVVIFFSLSPLVLFEKQAYDRRHFIHGRGRPMLNIAHPNVTLEALRVRRPVLPTQKKTHDVSLEGCPDVPVYEAELWTSRQRQASSIHEVSY